MINSTSNKQAKSGCKSSGKAQKKSARGSCKDHGRREFTPKDVVEALMLRCPLESQKEKQGGFTHSYEIVTEEVMKAMADKQRRLRVCWRWQGRRNTPWRSFKASIFRNSLLHSS